MSYPTDHVQNLVAQRQADLLADAERYRLAKQARRAARTRTEPRPERPLARHRIRWPLRRWLRPAPTSRA